MHRLQTLLDNRTARRVLWCLNGIVIALMMWATRNERSGDHGTYMALADGILAGRYSMQSWMHDFIPDTFRTPGFPLYLAGIIKVFGAWQAIQGVQLVLYVISLHLMLRIIARFDGSWLTGNIALLCLLPLVNVPYYITQVLPEIPTLACVTASVYLLTRPYRLSWLNAVALGLLYGFSFQCRPVYMLMPPLLALGALWANKRSFDLRGHALAIVVFVITLVPYSMWNKEHHGVFSPTPLEGGGGVMHFGIWAGAIPDHQEHRYWSNFTGDEIVRFVPEDSVASNIAAYEREWDDVQARLAPLKTHTDSLMEKAFDHGLCPARTYNTRYTLERERLLKEKAKALAAHKPGYALAYKSWSALRLWVIGIQRGNFLEANVLSKVKQLYATLSTLFILVLTVTFSFLAI
ncbi:MAG TPA: hypothetical protein PK760_08895, partial [Flavobacteriales bacterium]|nr:hypothetical protein [Flavobacteriales bacterium]